MSKKSRKTNPMIIDMIKANVHVELILWPLLQVKIIAGDDVERYEINHFRIAQPFVAVSEICDQHCRELSVYGRYGQEIELLNELADITGTGQMFPIHELRSAGWTVPAARRLEPEIAA